MECEPQNGAESESPDKDWTERRCALTSSQPLRSAGKIFPEIFSKQSECVLHIQPMMVIFPPSDERNANNSQRKES